MLGLGRKIPELRDLSHLAEKPWRKVADDALAEARTVPTMITPEEQQLYYWLTHKGVCDQGAIVDLGCFLGGSTASLAAGAADRGSAGIIHAFDMFTAGERQKRKHLYSRGVEPFDGNDVFDRVVDYLAPWQDRIRLHRGDILLNGWDGSPIELLIFDAGKRPESADAMAEIFFPALIPGQSILVQQDYQLNNHPWLICQLELLADFLKPLACTRRNSAIFQSVAPISRRAARRARTARLSDAAMIALMQKAMTRLAHLGLAPSIEKTIEALHLNPGKRRPEQFVKAP